MKVVYLFNGQGSQFVGMGADLFNNKIVKDVYKKSSQICDFSVDELSFNGPAEELNRTNKTQIAIVTMQLAIVEVLKSHGFNSRATAGLSLGEYSAIYNAGGIEFDSLIKIVKARGDIMDQMSKKIDGSKMVAVIGLDSNKTTSLVEKLQQKGYKLAVANYNSPEQQVVGGEKKAIEEFCKVATEAKRLIQLDVSVPSHTPLMEPTLKPFKNELAKIEFKKLNQDLYANINGEKTNCKQIKNNLLKQLVSSTHMEKTITNMINDGNVKFVEIGPKKVLNSFVKKIAKKLKRDVELINIFDNQSLKIALKKLEGE